MTIVFHDVDNPANDKHFAGALTQIVFGSAQYQWHNREENSYADPDGPPAQSQLTANERTKYEIPKASIVVLRGQVQ